LGRSLDDQLLEEARALRAAGLWRELAPGIRLADFTSNDYLGLSRDEVVIDAAYSALREHGAGARASRLLGGGSPLDRAAEEACAEWLDAEAALLFPTAFQANLGLIGALVGPGGVVCSDELNHASLIDGVRLSRAEVRVFPHCDLGALERELAAAQGARRRLVVTEGVFSMDGDIPPLRAMHELCAKYDAWLVVDEAHSVGLVGPQGAGAWAEAAQDGLGQDRLAARVVACGKALGASGGIVVGSRALREQLVNRARSFIFTTGAAPAVAGSICAAIEIARAADEPRAALRKAMKELCDGLGISAPPAVILPIVVGAEEPARAAAEACSAAGLDVRAVRPPTVPEGSARLRVVLHATNTDAELARLASALAGVPRVDAVAPKNARRAPLFVIGTDTGIGKTIVSALCARAAARVGPATYWKAVQTGHESDTEEVARLCADMPLALAEPHHHFPLPASPHEAAAAANSSVDLVGLDAQCAMLAAQPGSLIVELAGGLLVPYDDHFTQLDWLARLRPKLLLVARSGLGTLNHTLLSVEALRRRGLAPLALVLVGEPHESNRETLARMSGVPRVYELPQLAEVDAEALDAWLDAHPLDHLFEL
jgi:8-amino-7-oxononanoate synthase